jgi:hypothetical protein
MPEILQTSSPLLYSEPSHKECIIDLSESISLEDSNYNIHIYLSLPEIDLNQNVPSVNAELFESSHLLGKAYKTLKKHQSVSSLLRRLITELGVIFYLYEDVQDLKLSIPVHLSHDSQSLKLKIFPADLAIDSIKVEFEVKLTGFRYYLHEHFNFACIIGCFWLFIAQVLLLSLCRGKKKVE